MIEDVPHVSKEKRFELEDVGEGIHLLVLSYGFMDEADIPQFLSGMEVGGQSFNMMETTFFLGRETIIPAKKPE